MKRVTQKYKAYSLTEAGIEKYLNHHRNLDLAFYYKLIKKHRDELLKESVKIKRQLENEASGAVIDKGVAQIAANAKLDAWLVRLRAAVLAKLQGQIARKKASGNGRWRPSKGMSQPRPKPYGPVTV